jgi:hypothetical protein
MALPGIGVRESHGQLTSESFAVSPWCERNSRLTWPTGRTLTSGLAEACIALCHPSIAEGRRTPQPFHRAPFRQAVRQVVKWSSVTSASDERDWNWRWTLPSIRHLSGPGSLKSSLAREALPGTTPSSGRPRTIASSRNRRTSFVAERRLVLPLGSLGLTNVPKGRLVKKGRERNARATSRTGACTFDCHFLGPKRLRRR